MDNFTNGIINGKKQIIDMLKVMPKKEKDQLLKIIRIRNPQMARELSEKGLSFKEINNLSDENVKRLLPHISPQLFGIALKGSSHPNQKRILKLSPKNMAKEIYSVLISVPYDEKKIIRAQSNIIEVGIKILGKKAFYN